MAAVGMTFSPLNAPMPGQPGSQASPLQDAIKLLSFQLPSVVGAGAGSGVLGPPTAAGGLSAGVGDGSANSWLMQLLKGLVPDAGQTGMAPGAPPQAPGGPPRPAVQFPQAPVQQAPQMPGIGGGGGGTDMRQFVQQPGQPFSYLHG